MSDGHFGNFSKTGGKCPTIILANFQNQEEFVCSSFWQIFKNGRKMFNSHSDNFSKIGGKCPIAILTIFQKQEEIVIWQFL
jgi:predicted transcriptional regulator